MRVAEHFFQDPGSSRLMKWWSGPEGVSSLYVPTDACSKKLVQLGL